MSVLHPSTLESGVLLESAKKIVQQLCGYEWDKASFEVRAKAFELAIRKENARMIYECADSVARIAEEIRHS